jgi:glutamyl-tRNA reductase
MRNPDPFGAAVWTPFVLTGHDSMIAAIKPIREVRSRGFCRAAVEHGRNSLHRCVFQILLWIMTTDILVLNVGFTGVLVAEALAHHRDRSKFTFAIAGRSQQKLEALASSPSLNGVKTFCVDISNSNELQALVSKFKVVINCTSQYWELGIPVVRCRF